MPLPSDSPPNRPPTPRLPLWNFLRNLVQVFYSFLPANSFRLRFCIAFFFLFAIFGFVYCQLYKAHLHPNQAMVTTPREYKRELPAVRGTIYDRNGYALALSRPHWTICIDPGIIPDDLREEVYQTLLPYNICTPDRLQTALAATNSHYRKLGTVDDHDIVRNIATNSILRRCMIAESGSRRVYPLGHEASHLIGYINSNEEALDGLEKSLDRVLSGKPGYILGEANSRRVEIRSRRKEKVPPVNGNNVILSIDQNLQHAVNQALDEAMETFGPRSCWSIVQDTKTGEILAMASRPDFNPAEYGTSNPTSRWNSAIFKQYEPGSVMKAFAAAAALNEDLVQTNSILDVSPGLYCGRPLSDHVPSNHITVACMLEKSSNRGASRLGMALGKQRQVQYLRDFGFGERTGLPFHAGVEARGNLGYTPKRPWSDLQNIRVSIGQGVSVSGIQLVTAYSALGNGGKLLKPILVKKVVSDAGEVLWEMKPEVVRHPVREEVAKQVLKMMEGVCTSSGTGRRARVPGYTVSGKTGTAQIAIRGGYSKTDYCGSFVGFIPAENPRLTILVTLEAPPKRYHGGTVAAPIFSKIAEYAVNYLGIPPSGHFDDELTEEELLADEWD
ncbi:MAG: peptidoglycan D,D-transpeptidase FtsI family protein [Kiritimatiellia bacterium]